MIRFQSRKPLAMINCTVHEFSSHAIKVAEVSGSGVATPITLCLYVMAKAKLETGYECNFVSEPDDSLKCLICLAVARDPWQHGKCGRLFCEKCICKHGKNKPCPNCRMEQPQYLEDTRSKWYS